MNTKKWTVKSLKKALNKTNKQWLTIKSLVTYGMSFDDTYDRNWHNYASEPHKGKLVIDVFPCDDEFAKDLGIDYDFEISCDYDNRIADKQEYENFSGLFDIEFPNGFEIVREYDENDCKTYFIKQNAK